MSNSPQTVSLGTFTFDELRFEVPENLEIIKKTLGGSAEIPQAPGKAAQVVTQTYGVVVEPIKLDAWFIGADALANAQKLEAIQLQQNVVTFTFGTLSFDVTVMSFAKRFRSITEIGYTLELTPQVETSVDSGTSDTASASSALSDSLNNISTAFVDPTLPSDSVYNAQAAQITAAQTACANATPSTFSLTDFQNLSATLLTGMNALSVIMTAKQGSTVSSDVGYYLYAASLRGQMATAVSLIGTFTGSSSTSTINPAGLNAYQIAVRYTGDIGNTDAIMQANSLTDPFNLGTAPIVIPSGLNVATQFS